MGKITVEHNVNGIEGLHVITPTAFGDERGYFMETYNYNDFKEAGIEGSMPGSSLSQARFVYLTGWLDQMVNNPFPEIKTEIPEYTFADQTSAMVLSLMRGVSTPYGLVFDTEHLNNTSTLWRTISDVKNGIFYFDSALLPLTFKIDLNQVDFTKSKVISPYKDNIPQGDITDLFK